MKTLLHILVFLTSLCLASASNISYFSTPEITFSTPSGRPGSSNLNNVYCKSAPLPTDSSCSSPPSSSSPPSPSSPSESH